MALLASCERRCRWLARQAVFFECFMPVLDVRMRERLFARLCSGVSKEAITYAVPRQRIRLSVFSLQGISGMSTGRQTSFLYR